MRASLKVVYQPDSGFEIGIQAGTRRARQPIKRNVHLRARVCRDMSCSSCGFDKRGDGPHNSEQVQQSCFSCCWCLLNFKGAQPERSGAASLTSPEVSSIWEVPYDMLLRKASVLKQQAAVSRSKKFRQCKRFHTGETRHSKISWPWPDCWRC